MEKTLRDEFLLHEILGFLRGLGQEDSLGTERQKGCIEYAQRLRFYNEARKPSQDSKPQEESPNLREAVVSLLPVIDAPTSAAFEEAVAGVYKALGINREDSFYRKRGKNDTFTSKRN